MMSWGAALMPDYRHQPRDLFAMPPSGKSILDDEPLDWEPVVLRSGVDAAIPLANGLVTLVDEIDLERLGDYNWRIITPCRKPYVFRNARNGSKMKMIYLHREIMGAPAGMTVDHASGDTLDNRRCNLRLATSAQNSQNSCRKRVSRTGYQGVYPQWNTGKFFAAIRASNQVHKQFHYQTPELAAVAYDLMALHLHGEFARTNFLRERYYPTTNPPALALPATANAARGESRPTRGAQVPLPSQRA